jgi:hypothetical protein
MANLNIRKGADTKLPRVTIHGQGGIGKTTFASKFPSPIIIPTEDGCGALDVDKFDLVTDWQGLLNCLRQLLSTDHQYKTVVIDSLDVGEKLLQKFVTNRDYEGNWEAKKGGKSFMGFHAGFKTCAMEVGSMLELIDQLRNEKGMGCVLIAHTGTSTVKNPLGNDFGKQTANLHKLVWDVIFNWSDIVGYAHREMSVIGAGSVSDVGKARYSSKARIISFEGDGGLDAKSRAGYEMPTNISLSYTEFASHLNKASADKEGDLLTQFNELVTEVSDEVGLKAKEYIGTNPTEAKLKTAINKLLVTVQGQQEKQDVQSL